MKEIEHVSGLYSKIKIKKKANQMHISKENSITEDQKLALSTV